MPNLPSDPCVNKMVASGEGHISSDEAQQLHDSIRDQLKSADPKDLPKLTEAWKEQIKQMYDEQGKMAQRSYLDGRLREERLAEVQSRPSESEKLDWFKGKIEAMNKNVSIQQAHVANGFDNSLKAKIDPIIITRLKSGSLDPELASYLKSGKNPDALASIKEPEVRKAIQDYAKSFDDSKKPLIEDNNNRGAMIADKPDYVGRQTHDPSRLQKADPEEWFKNFSKTFDLNESYPGLTPEQQKANAMKFRGEVITGRHTGADEVSEQMASLTHVDPFKRFMAGGGPLVRQSQARTFEPISAQAQLDYMKQYGKGDGTLYDNHVELLKSLARSSAQADVWGSNPIKNFDTVRNKFRDENSTSPKIQNQMADGQRIDNMFKLVSGQLAKPPGTGTLFNNFVYKPAQTLMSVERLAKLWLSPFSHMPAVGVGPKTELTRAGIPLSEQNWNAPSRALSIIHDWAEVNFIKPMQNFMDKIGISRGVENLEPAHRAMLADLLGSSQPSSVFRDDPSAIGYANNWMNWIEDRMVKLTGRESIINDPREQAVNGLTQHFGLLRNKEFGELPGGIQNYLKRYDIRPDEWEGVRKNISTNEFGDHQLNHWNDVSNIEGMSPNEKNSLIAKFNHMFGEAMDRSSFSPSTNERAFAYGGTLAESPERLGRQLFWQFRLPALKINNTLFGEAVSGQQSLVSKLKVVATADGALILGALAGNSAREMVSGKDVQRWDNPSTWLSAIERADGFGFYGTQVFRNLLDSKHMPKDLATFAGSVFGNVPGEAMKAAQNWINESSSNKSQHEKGVHGFIDQAASNLPGHGIPFGVGKAMDKYFWDSIHDRVQPGWAERRDMRNQQYQKRAIFNAK